MLEAGSGLVRTSAQPIAATSAALLVSNRMVTRLNWLSAMWPNWVLAKVFVNLYEDVQVGAVRSIQLLNANIQLTAISRNHELAQCSRPKVVVCVCVFVFLIRTLELKRSYSGGCVSVGCCRNSRSTKSSQTEGHISSECARISLGFGLAE